MFQYRKRYGLHAILPHDIERGIDVRFNTASGMDCMQFQVHFGFIKGGFVSIPQAVWIACNSAPSASAERLVLFQYRKRYGLHAIAGAVFMGVLF